jgi:hypothetical protein
MSPSARKLTTHQQSVLIQVLLAFPAQTAAVRYSSSVSDARAYAEDFLTIFKAVGWIVDEVKSVDAGEVNTQTAGLAVIVGNDHELPPGAEALRDALRIYGIEVQTIADSGAKITPGNFVLRVGTSV